MTFDLCLGDAVNLLDGLQPVWHDGTSRAAIATPLAQTPLLRFPITPSAENGPWDPVRISLHAGPGGLVDALFDYTVLGIRDDLGQRRLRPSTLLLGAAETRTSLIDGAAETRCGMVSRLIGIDLERGDIAGFALIQVTRADALHHHDVMGGGLAERVRIDRFWQPEGRQTMTRLRMTAPGLDPDGIKRAGITPSLMPRYLDYFYACGTHFIARVGIGQKLFQVLGFPADRFAFLTEFWQREAGGGPISGALAASFALYAGPDWTVARGPIVSAAAEPALGRSYAEGAWNSYAEGVWNSYAEGAWQSDGRRHQADLLLAPFMGPRHRADRLLRDFTNSAVLRVDLMPQSYLMNEFRSAAWQKVINGALLQRYGGEEQPPPAVPTPSPRRALPLADHLNGAELGARRRGGDAVIALSLTLTAGQTIDLPDEVATLMAARIEAEPDADQTAVISVADSAFDRLGVYAAEIWGGFLVVNHARTRRETYAHGLRFGSDAAGRVVGFGDPRYPPLAVLSDLRDSLDCMLDMARVLMADPDAATDLAMRGCHWVADIIKQRSLDIGDGTEAAAWNALQRRALSVARLGTDEIPPITINPEAVPRLITLATRIAELALDATHRQNGTSFAESDGIDALCDELARVLTLIPVIRDEAPLMLKTPQNPEFLQGMLSWRLAAVLATLCAPIMTQGRKPRRSFRHPAFILLELVTVFTAKFGRDQRNRANS